MIGERRAGIVEREIGERGRERMGEKMIKINDKVSMRQICAPTFLN